MMETILTGGGIGGLIVAVAYAYQQWQASRREHQAEPRTAATAAVTDAATANSLLLATIHDARVELDRREGEVDRLRIQVARLHEEKRQLIHKYEAELATLRQQLNAVSARLEQVQHELRAEDNDNDGPHRPS